MGDIGCWNVIALENASVLVVDVVDVVDDGDVGDSASVDGVRVTLGVIGAGVAGVIPRFDPIAGVDGGGNDDVNDPDGKSCDDALDVDVDVVGGKAENVAAGGGGDVSGGVRTFNPLGAAVDVPENAAGMQGGDV